MEKKKAVPRAGLFRIIRMAAGSPLLLKEVSRFAGCVLRDFFIPQFSRIAGVSSRPVVSVDHRLDRTIPFYRGGVKVYLSFIRFWVDPLVHVHRVEGRKTLPLISSFIADLSRFYKEAGCVYRSVNSTTVRPVCLRNPRFVMIHLFDPHLNCVPSLHVIVSCYAYRKIAGILPLFPSFPDADMVKSEMEDTALRIVESVLRIKQHSVNCVAAGLFFLTCHYDSFTEAEAMRFCSRLFSGKDSGCSDPAGVRSCIAAQYRSFLADYSETPDCCGVLVSFLKSYVSRASSGDNAVAEISVSG
ncbi:MAG: hypothetical protein ACRCUT_05100 [Spirochaetota bacterium]